MRVYVAKSAATVFRSLEVKRKGEVREPRSRIHAAAAAASLRGAHIGGGNVASTRGAAVRADGRHRATVGAVGVRCASRSAHGVATAGVARRTRRSGRRFAPAAALSAVSGAAAFAVITAFSIAWRVAKCAVVSFGAGGETKSTEPNS